MWLTKVPIRRVKCCYRATAEAGAPLSSKQIEIHHLAGGNIERMTEAWIKNHGCGEPMTWHAICALDLAGRDPRRAVQIMYESGGKATFDEIAAFSRIDDGSE